MVWVGMGMDMGMGVVWVCAHCFGLCRCIVGTAEEPRHEGQDETCALLRLKMNMRDMSAQSVGRWPVLPNEASRPTFHFRGRCSTRECLGPMEKVEYCVAAGWRRREGLRR
jgi:hypothetical protein